MPFELSRLTRVASRDAGARCHTTGNERLPILVLDDFLQHPLEVRALASTLRFVEATDLRVPSFVSVAALDETHIAKVLCAAIGRHFYDDAATMEHHGNGWRFYRAEDRPGAPARLPAERPRTSPHLLIAQVFLNLPEQCRGGTGFFRHATTGVESLIPADVMAGRFPDGRSSRHWRLDTGLRDRLWEGPRRTTYERERAAKRCGSYEHFAGMIAGAPGDRYQNIIASERDWELHEVVEMKFNRLVAFPGYAFHSDIFRPEWFGPAPDENRLLLQFEFNWPGTPRRSAEEPSSPVPHPDVLAQPSR
jgi:hypothetical protein